MAGNIWIEHVVFRRPFFLKDVGTELPAGSYAVQLQDQEYSFGGRPVRSVVGCKIQIPASLLRSGQLDAWAGVNHKELRERQAEDAEPDRAGGSGSSAEK